MRMNGNIEVHLVPLAVFVRLPLNLVHPFTVPLNLVHPFTVHTIEPHTPKLPCADMYALREK
jgi:hypothetical protein